MAVYIIFKYIFVYVAPFLVAFLIVRILNPAAIRLQKYPCFRKVGKGSLLFCMMSLVLGITGVCMWFLGVRLFAQIRSIFLHIDQYEAKMETMIDGCCVLLNQKFGMKSEAIREIVYQNIEKCRKNTGSQYHAGFSIFRAVCSRCRRMVQCALCDFCGCPADHQRL